MKSLLTTALITLTMGAAHANTLEAKALAYVPNGTIISQEKFEFDVLTPNKTIVEIEFKRNGNFDEASGDNLLNDTFKPDAGIVGLDTVASAINAQESGDVAIEWSLEHDLIHGWHYEVEVVQNHIEYEYLIDAKTGQVIRKKVD